MTKGIMKKLAFLLSVVMVISLFTNVNWTVRAEGSSIDASSYSEEYNDCWITTNSDYDSILVPADCHLTIEGANVTATSVTIEAGGCIHIVDAGEGEEAKTGQLSIASSLTASDGAEIECGSNQNIPTVGGTQIQLYDGDDLSLNADSEWQGMTFRYTDSESGGKWYVLPEYSPQFNDYEYNVMYDTNGDASVTVNGKQIGDCVTQAFSKDEVLVFTLTPPDFRQGETPIVEIVVHDGDESTGKPETVWRSDFEDSNPQKITLVDNTFTFKPQSEKGFEVFISWSEYDAFGGNDEYPILVEIECSGSGTIDLQGVSEENKIVSDNWIKARFVEGTSTVNLSWTENSAPRRIVVDGGEEYTQFSGTSQVVNLNLDGNKFCYIRAEFDDQGGSQFKDYEYSVMYDPNGDASVTVNGELIGDCETKTFSVDDELNFILTPPDFRQGETPIVEIVIHDGDESTGTPETVWRSDFEDSNPQKIALVNNTFSFTPTSEKGFEVFINWSEFDAFGENDEYPVLVMIDCTGEGTIGIDGVSDENKFVWNNFTKVRVAKDTASLTLTWEENAAPQEIRVEGGDVNAEDGWLILGESDFSNNSCSIPLTQTEDNGSQKSFYYVQVQYDGGGAEENNQYNFKRLQEELNGTYFAFGDINGDGSADINDLKYGVMRPLYDDFRVKEGRYQREGAALGLIEDFDKDNPANLNANMKKLLDLASVDSTPIPGDTITAKDKNGATHTFNAYQITITIDKLYENRSDLTVFPGVEEATSLGEQSIVLTTKAYLIDMTNSDEQVIIKVKDNYFVRDAYSDPRNNNDYDLERFDGLNAWALILVADYDTKEDIVLFGNYVSATETFSDETSDRFFASGFGSGETGNKYLGDKFVVMKPGFFGVTINGSGETKEPLAWSVTSSLSIAETGVNSGNDTETDIYFGFDSVEIAPITSGKVEGLGVTSISDVEVLDGIPENAVKVEETAPGSKYTVHFLSDYYDTVRIKVTYNTEDNGEQSGIMTLNRVGIMIQGGMTAGDSHTVNIFHGHDMGETLDNDVYEEYKAANTDKTHGDYGFAYYATYYYPTDSNAASADTSLFVTYTYADGSVERKLLQSNYFTAATEENVAMSDYILYMGDGSNAPVKVEAIAIPNVNADGTIDGAKLGAGKGVEGTFDIEFE